MEFSIQPLKKAIASLERSIRFAQAWEETHGTACDGVETIRAGVIQNFEFVYELSWKYMQRWLKNNVSPERVEGVSRKELFRMAIEQQLIVDFEKWVIFHEARNRATHTYDEANANEVYALASEFLSVAQPLYDRLEERMT